MVYRKEMTVFQDNMWLIVSLMAVTSPPSLLLQTQVVLLFQIWQQHQSNLSALKDAVTAQNSARTRYHKMKLRYVLFFIQKTGRIKPATDAAEIHKCSFALAYTIVIQRIKLV